MRILLTGALVAASIVTAVPAFAQSIDIGPGGPRIDLRSRAERERDFRREEYRREEYRRDREAERRAYRRERYMEERRDEERAARRGYGY